MIVSEENATKAVVKSLIAVLLSTNRITTLYNVWSSTYHNEAEHQTLKNNLSELNSRVAELELFQKDILEKVDRLLSSLPDDTIRLPQIDVVYPLSQSVLINEMDDKMKEVYANLFVNASSKENSRFVHPSFAGIINQLTVDEIKLLESLENSQTMAWPVVDVMDTLGKPSSYHPVLTNFTTYGLNVIEQKENIGVYLDNLQRINLINIPDDSRLMDGAIYESLMIESYFRDLIPNTRIHKHTQFFYLKKSFRLTNLGAYFKKACFNQRIT